MSWHLLLMRISRDVVAVDELAATDWEPPELGSRADVNARIDALVPGAVRAEPSRTTLRAGGGAVEILTLEDPVTSITLRFVGGGDAVLDVARRLEAAFGLRAIDGSSGEFASPGDLEAWQAYRDRTV